MRRYTLAQLEALLAIAQHGSFRLAAVALGVTQPTISLRIRDLEIALGQPLFKRNAGQPRLTQNGLGILRHAERCFALLDEMERQIKAGEMAMGTLRVGSSNTFALAFLPAVLAEMERRFPHLVIDLTISDSNTLAALANSGGLDVVILLEGHFRRSIRVEPLATYEIAWISAAANHLPESLTVADLRGRRIATLPPTSPLSRTILDWFDAAGAPQPVQSRCNDMATLVQLVTAGAALSILPLCVVAAELEQGRVVAHMSQPKLQHYQLCVAYPAQKPHPSLDAFLTVTKKAIQSGHIPYFTLTEQAEA